MLYLLYIVSETSLVHEMHIRSSKSVIMCFQHVQETLQNNPSYENLSGAQHGSRTILVEPKVGEVTISSILGGRVLHVIV